MPSSDDDVGQGTSKWRRMELFLEAGELKRALEAAADAAGGATVSCVVGDAFLSMTAKVGVPWVAVWTGSPSALLAHLVGDAPREDIGDAPREDIGDDHRTRGDELLTSFPGLGSYRVRDLPFGGGGFSGGMHRVAQRLPRAATTVAINAFPGLLPPDEESYTGISFGRLAAPPPDEASGAPFLWSLREKSWPLLPPVFLDRAKAGNHHDSAGLVVPWAPQAAVLRHPAVGAFVTHSGWGAIVEGMSGGVPMACRPFFGDQHMNARAVARLWCFGTSFDDDDGKPLLTRVGVAEEVASLLAREGEGARMRARAQKLQPMMAKAFEPDGGLTNNFHKFVR
ncbi:hypothetical protein E2562_032225 [Oryza meyeriana var. granulata]|uniref:Uncharacterized protein n=1 Tax=Oryza meyeriana var. granulata TaxID=110450 RepID=A0A6G1D9U3_9ORYZ|nr:hypothetical protein E2562_032225 [Oryza meyeriana var. granulata]